MNTNKRLRIYLLAFALSAALLLAGCDFLVKEKDDEQPRQAYYMLNLNTGEEQRLLYPSEGNTVRVTADGQYMIYKDTSGNLVRKSLETGEKYIYSLPFDSYTFCPATDVINMMAVTDGQYDVYKVDVQTGAIENLTEVQEQNEFPYCISWEQQKIYYSLGSDSLYTLYVKDMNTQEVSIITSNSISLFYGITLSPFSNTLYYQQGSAESGHTNLYKMDIATQDTVSLRSVNYYEPSKNGHIRIGIDDLFYYTVNYVFFFGIDAEPQLLDLVSGYCDLLSNGYEAIYITLSGDFVIDNVLTGEVRSIDTRSYSIPDGEWFSREGNLYIFYATPLYKN